MPQATTSRTKGLEEVERAAALLPIKVPSAVTASAREIYIAAQGEGFGRGRRRDVVYLFGNSKHLAVAYY